MYALFLDSSFCSKNVAPCQLLQETYRWCKTVATLPNMDNRAMNIVNITRGPRASGDCPLARFASAESSQDR